jgi:hypothetical protein
MIWRHGALVGVFLVGLAALTSGGCGSVSSDGLGKSGSGGHPMAGTGGAASGSGGADSGGSGGGSGGSPGGSGGGDGGLGSDLDVGGSGGAPAPVTTAALRTAMSALATRADSASRTVTSSPVKAAPSHRGGQARVP